MDKNCLTLSHVLPTKVHKLCTAITEVDLGGGALIPSKVFPIIISLNPPYVVGSAPIYLKRPDGKKYPALQLSGGDILVLGILPADSLHVNIQVQCQMCQFLVSRGRVVTYLVKKSDSVASDKPDFVAGE